MSKQYKNYFVVEFPDEMKDGVTPMMIIPLSWLLDDSHCLWPTFNSERKKTKAIINNETPDKEKALTCKINIKFKTNSYEKAIEKLKLLEKLDITQSDSDNEDPMKKRPLIPNKKYIETNSSSEEEVINEITDGETEENIPIVPPMVANEPNITDEPERPLQLPESLVNSLNRQEALLKKIHMKQKFMSDDLLVIKAQLSSLSKEPHITEIKDIVQVSNIEELKDFNEKLKKTEFFNEMCTTLKLIGGKDVVDGTRRILTKIINNNLAKQCNWSGKNGKHAFSSYRNILDLILASLRKNPMTREATNKEIEDVLKNWLRTAGDREGGRCRRKTDGNNTEAIAN